jgi:DNA-binding LytR/AlgR family response regulator
MKPCFLSGVFLYPDPYTLSYYLDIATFLNKIFHIYLYMKSKYGILNMMIIFVIYDVSSSDFFLLLLDTKTCSFKEKMNCIIVDDDKLSCKLLEGYVSKSSSLTLIGIYSDSVLARNELSKRHDIDLIFLDIRMPEMDGFDFIGSLEVPPNIIIVSSAEEFALKAFDFNVVDYLLKPVSYSRFCKAIDKTIRYFARKETPNTGDEEIFIKKGSSLVKLKLKEIIFVEALENYVTLNTKEERFTIHFTMKAIENQLPSGIFIRVHRSFIINKSMIQAIKENSLDLVVGDTVKTIPVGKSFRDFLLNDINVMAR